MVQNDSTSPLKISNKANQQSKTYLKQEYNILISVGCNKDCDTQMARVRERLKQSFPDIVFTDAITTPAYGMSADALPYANLLAKASTVLSEEQLQRSFKEMEHELDDTQELRRQDIVMMDIDLLEYDSEKRHVSDWERPYVIELLPQLRRITLLLILTLSFLLPAHSLSQNEPGKKQDTELLGKAVEYFQGGKYHECIITFEKLKKHYKLTPRFKAYLGMCYYKEQKYAEAIDNLKEGIPELSAYSPKEQSVYIYSCAESLFHLKRYKESIEYYEKVLPLTEGNDKGDVLFHTAFAYYLQEDHNSAIPFFKQALQLYTSHTHPGDDLHIARKKQVETMLRALAPTLSE